jgi:hypothetical protein
MRYLTQWEQLQVMNQSDVDFESIYGKDFKFLQDMKPSSEFLAIGSKIAIEEGKER